MKRLFLLCMLLVFGMSAAIPFTADAARAQSATKKESKKKKGKEDAPKAYCIKLKRLEKSGSRQKGQTYSGRIDVSSLPQGKYCIWLCNDAKKAVTVDLQINSGDWKEMSFNDDVFYHRAADVEIPGKGFQINLRTRGGSRVKLRPIVITPTQTAPEVKEVKNFPELKIIK
ncbi:MAG: hypothetical protein MJ033_05845 [Victivallaceae bacterium]|nr:hypothetical protein [Victivallaceae bacterium]